ncbi:MAG: GTPase Era [Schleiferiaceae bacterium]|nr:GTPase Era [Schleiferiaceae bacterium]MDR9441951.1 GTPase Era [Schleiferiaceae bacterium]
MAHKAGFVSLLGNPNVGKSTLLNAFLGTSLAIATPKAQTTRHRILGIYNTPEVQIVFSDTPGVIQPAYALQEQMMDAVQSTFEDSDLVMMLTEPTATPLKDEKLEKRLRQLEVPLFVVINKIDTVAPAEVEAVFHFWQQRFPQASIYPIAALEKFQVPALLEEIKQHLPEAPPYFPKEDLSDRHDRFFVAEMIREQILLHYQKEVPYATEVAIEEYREEEDINRIRALIYVERSTQKGILLGHQGKAIKRVGTAARKRMESFLGKKVFLELYVKVRPDWRKKDEDLRRFGYKP